MSYLTANFPYHNRHKSYAEIESLINETMVSNMVVDIIEQSILSSVLFF